MSSSSSSSLSPQYPPIAVRARGRPNRLETALSHDSTKCLGDLSVPDGLLAAVRSNPPQFKKVAHTLAALCSLETNISVADSRILAWTDLNQTHLEQPCFSSLFYRFRSIMEDCDPALLDLHGMATAMHEIVSPLDHLTVPHSSANGVRKSVLYFLMCGWGGIKAQRYDRALMWMLAFMCVVVCGTLEKCTKGFSFFIPSRSGALQCASKAFLDDTFRIWRFIFPRPFCHRVSLPCTSLALVALCFTPAFSLELEGSFRLLGSHNLTLGAVQVYHEQEWVFFYGGDGGTYHKRAIAACRSVGCAANLNELCSRIVTDDETCELSPSGILDMDDELLTSLRIPNLPYTFPAGFRVGCSGNEENLLLCYHEWDDDPGPFGLLTVGCTACNLPEWAKGCGETNGSLGFAAPRVTRPPEHICICRKDAFWSSTEQRCLPCPAGKESLEGSMSADQCMCPSGMELSEEGNCQPCAAGQVSALGLACKHICPPGTYLDSSGNCVRCRSKFPRRVDGDPKDICVLPWADVPSWGAKSPGDAWKTLPPLDEGRLAATQVALRQSWSELGLGVQLPLKDGWQWARGSFWVAARSGWDFGDQILIAHFAIDLFDATSANVEWRLLEAWQAQVGLNGTVQDVQWETGMHATMLSNGWTDDESALADVMFRARGSNEAIAVRLPIPRFAFLTVFSAAWLERFEWIGEKGILPAVQPLTAAPSPWSLQSKKVVLEIAGLSSQGWCNTSVDLQLVRDKVVDVAVGGFHSCLLFWSGSKSCWGLGRSGQLGFPDYDFVPMASDYRHIPPFDAVSLTAGIHHTCILYRDGSVRCSGRNLEGQCGILNVDFQRSFDTTVNLDEHVIAVSAGGYHTCAVLASGSISCWGDASEGQLGYGNTANVGRETSVKDAGTVSLGVESAVAIAAGTYHTCAITESKKLFCWGSNFDGQLGYGETNNVGDKIGRLPVDLGPVNVGGAMESVNAGELVTCAMLEGMATVRCWGPRDLNGYASGIDVGSDILPTEAGDVDIGDHVASIHVGFAHSCALLASGDVRCWGDSNHGVLGYGSLAGYGIRSPPSAAGTVDLGGRALRLASMSTHTCALLISNVVRCWGLNKSYQLGTGALESVGDDEVPKAVWGELALVPVAFLSLPSISGAPISSKGYAVTLPSSFPSVMSPPEFEIAIADVVSNKYVSCALENGTGLVYCWGDSAYGALGKPGVFSIASLEEAVSRGAVDVGGLATSITIGEEHVCVIITNGSVVCWGSQYGKQLGYDFSLPLGVDEAPSSAGMVPIGEPVSQIVAGSYHTCVLLSAGRVRCFGVGYSGQLGYGIAGIFSASEIPGDVFTNGSATALSAGGDFTCAIMAKGGVTCWGNGFDGRLGRGSDFSNIGDDETPGSVGIIPGSDQLLDVPFSISSGFHHTCVVTKAGQLFCWGVATWDRFVSPSLFDGITDYDHNFFPFLEPVSDVSCFQDSSCVIHQSGRMSCWSAKETRVEFAGPRAVKALGRGLSLNHVCILYHGQNGTICDHFSLLFKSVTSMPVNLTVNAGGVLTSYLETEEIVSAGSHMQSQLIESIALPGFSGPLPSFLPFSTTSLSVGAASDWSSRCAVQFSTIGSASLCLFDVSRGSQYTAGAGVVSVSASLFTKEVSASTLTEVVAFGNFESVAASSIPSIEGRVLLPGMLTEIEGLYFCRSPKFDSNYRKLTCTMDPVLAKLIGFLLPHEVDWESHPILSVSPPQLSFASPSSTPVEGGVEIVVSGLNFGPPSVVNPLLDLLGKDGSDIGADFKPSEFVEVKVDDSACENTRLLSSTQLSCLVPPGIGDRAVSVVVAEQQSANQLYITSLPVAFGWSPSNVAGWRDLGDATSLQIAWQAEKDYINVLGQNGIFEIFVDGVFLTTVSAVPSDSVAGFEPSQQDMLAFQARVPVPIHPVDVSIRGARGTIMSNMSETSPKIPASCVSGSFLLDVSDTEVEDHLCVMCLEGAECPTLSKHDDIVALEGYWQLFGEEDERWEPLHGLGFAACPNPSACLGGGINLDARTPSFLALGGDENWISNSTLALGKGIDGNESSLCAEGHTGTLCARCMPGYFSDSGGACRPCGTPAEIGLSLTAFTIATFVCFTFYTASIVFSVVDLTGDAKGLHGSISSATKYLQMSVAHVQSLSVLMGIVTVPWSDSIASFFSVLQTVSLPGASQVGQCAMGANDPVTNAALRAIAFPVALIAYSGLLWFVWDSTFGRCKCCSSNTSEDDDDEDDNGEAEEVTSYPIRTRSFSERMLDASSVWWRRFGTSLFIVATLVHKPITEAGLSLLSCVNVQPAEVPSSMGEPALYASPRLRSDLDQPCSEPGREVFAGLIIIIAVGIPLGILCMLLYFRREIKEGKSGSWVSTLAFMYGGFKPNLYYWLVIEMVWSVILVTATVRLGGQGPVMQFQTGVAISATEVLLSGWYKPYRDDTKNGYNTALKYVRILSLVGGAMVADTASRPPDQQAPAASQNGIISAILIVANTLGVAYGIMKSTKCLRKYWKMGKTRVSAIGKTWGFSKTTGPNRRRSSAPTMPFPASTRLFASPFSRKPHTSLSSSPQISIGNNAIAASGTREAVPTRDFVNPLVEARGEEC